MARVDVTLDANVAAYVASMKAASTSTAALASRIGATSAQVTAAQSKMAASAQRTAAASARASAQQAAAAKSAAAAHQAAAARSQASMTSLGNGMVKAGTVGAVGLGLMAKAAVDWESDWAGVTKTVDGTAPVMAALEGSLRDMAKTMPTSHRDIAKVAESAGALGVKTPDIAAFTKTMIQLGDTTDDLSADEAATSFAQFMNVMGTSGDQVDNLGSALVHLGNNGASTEGQIIGLAQRIAASGSQIKLTEAEVLGFASAVTSTGVGVELGGTAISKTFAGMGTAVSKGGESLDKFAKVAGVTSAEFAAQFKTAPAAAIDSFVEGLGRIKAEGGDVNGTLRSMGITGSNQIMVLGNLAGASKAAGRDIGLLTQSLKDSDIGMTNGALGKEAGVRYETTASKIKIAWNNIKDAAITAGAAILPVLGQVAGQVSKMASAFGELSPGTQSFLVKALAVSTAALLIGGGAIKAVTGVLALKTALAGLTGAQGAAAGSAMGLTKALGLAGAAYAAVAAGGAILDKLSSKGAGQGQISADLVMIGQSAKGTTGSLDTLSKSVFGQVNAWDRVRQVMEGQPVHIDNIGTAFKAGNVKGGMLGFTKGFLEVREALMPGRQMFERAADGVKKVDTGFKDLVAGGNLDVAQKSFLELAEATNLPPMKLMEQLPEYRAELLKVAEANGVHNLSAAEMADWMGGKVPAAMAAAVRNSTDYTAAMDGVATALAGIEPVGKLSAEGISAVSQAIFKNGDAFQSSVESHAAFEGAVDAANDAIERNGTTLGKSGKALSDNTAKGRENIAALGGIAASGKAHVQALLAQGKGSKELSDATREVRGEFIRAADAAGLTKKQAADLADSYGLIPKKVRTKFDAIGLAILNTQVATYEAQLAGLPPEVQNKVRAIFEKDGADAALKYLNSLDKKTARPKIIAPTDAALKVAGLTRAEFESIPAETKARISAAYANGDTKKAERELKKIGDTVATFKVKGDTKNAEAGTKRVNRGLSQVDEKVAKPTIKAPSRAAQNLANGTTQALNKTGNKTAKPKITTPGSGAKKRADDTSSSFDKTGRKNAKPKITAPSTAAKSRADQTSSSFDKTGRKNARPKIAAPSTAAQSRANSTTSALQRTDRMNARPSITVSANTSAIGRVRGALASLRDRVVNVITRKVKGATGGLASAGGFTHFAKGGPVWGAGTATSDSIDAKLSAGEYVTRAKAVAYYGVGALQALNQMRVPKDQVQGFAAGGLVGAPANVNIGQLVSLIAAIANPLKTLSTLTATAAAAQKKYNTAMKTLVAPKRTLDAATRTDNAARKAKADNAAQNSREMYAARVRVAAAKKAVDTGGKATKKEQRALKAAYANQSKVSRDNAKQQADHNAKIVKTTAAKTKAATAYNAVAAKTTASAEALKAANEALATSQQQVADTARTVAATFAAQYNSVDITDPRDLLALKQEGATDLAAFNKKLLALRAAGLNDEDVQDVVDKGVQGGGEMADAILAGGKAMVDSLNTAQANLAKAAAAVGLTSATNAVKKAAGGWITGPGTTTSDDVPVMASNREFIVNAASAAANAELLQHINSSSRSVIARNYIRGGGVVSSRQSSAVASDGRPAPVIHQHFPASADPRAAASAAGGRVSAALSAIGV